MDLFHQIKHSDFHSYVSHYQRIIQILLLIEYCMKRRHLLLRHVAKQHRRAPVPPTAVGRKQSQSTRRRWKRMVQWQRWWDYSSSLSAAGDQGPLWIYSQVAVTPPEIHHGTWKKGAEDDVYAEHGLWECMKVFHLGLSSKSSESLGWRCWTSSKLTHKNLLQILNMHGLCMGHDEGTFWMLCWGDYLWYLYQIWKKNTQLQSNRDDGWIWMDHSFYGSLSCPFANKDSYQLLFVSD